MARGCVPSLDQSKPQITWRIHYMKSAEITQRMQGTHLRATGSSTDLVPISP